QAWRRERRQLEQEQTDHAAASERGGRAKQRARASADHAAGCERELQVLRSTRGAAVEELLQQLEDLRRHQEQVQAAREQSHRDIADAKEERGRADNARQEAKDRRSDSSAERASAIARLREVVGEGLLAGLGGDWRAPLPAAAADSHWLELARRLGRELATVAVDERAADQMGTRMSQANQDLQTALSVQNYQVRIEERHGLTDVRIPHAGRDCDVAELAERLHDDIAQRQLLLTQHEREVIENFLIDEACEHLHRLLHEAASWVEGVNRELAERPMSTGLSLRFAQRVADDAAAGTGEAVQRLLRPQHAWSPLDREALAAYLQQAIAVAREAMPGHSWQEQLSVALDYRRWHRIGIERRQDGRWKPLTRATHGTGSGGEKAIALTVPQFAAAAAHYSAIPWAPRLIMLDEAFVGIDTDMRKKCMGLLVAFELDVVLTSEREWGCYETVPALAIYQLAGGDGSDCIASTRYVWNGRERRQEHSELEEAAQQAGNTEITERHRDS
ncbi:MAG: SbcC/MukB-like Walker B domain-containing protein, partial [Planctomycetota bacterium]